VTIYNLQSQLLLEHEVNNLFSVNKTNFIHSTVRNSKHHTYTLLWNLRPSITTAYQQKQSNFFTRIYHLNITSVMWSIYYMYKFALQ